MREHITSNNKKVGTRHNWLSGSTAFPYTERQITLEVQQCKADIDIHHGEHGNMVEQSGTKRNEVRGNNILSPQSPPI